jgi:hypothetical protein
VRRHAMTISILVISIWLAAAALIVGGTALWVVALVDVLRRESAGENEKLIWILVVILTGWIGALIYWFVGRDKGTLVSAGSG